MFVYRFQNAVHRVWSCVREPVESRVEVKCPIPVTTSKRPIAFWLSVAFQFINRFGRVTKPRCRVHWITEPNFNQKSENEMKNADSHKWSLPNKLWDEYLDELHLHLGRLADSSIQSNLQEVHLSEERETIYRCRYSKDVHGTKCQSPTIARLTQSLYTAKTARIRCYTTLSTIFKCEDVQRTPIVYIKCKDIQSSNKCVH